MKQAICLLAFKSKEYIEKFIEQFQNHPELVFYIHWHGHTQEECLKLKKEHSNIAYICNLFNTQRFSDQLVYAELYLYAVAIKNEEIGMCHLMSESDYLICSPQHFVDTFNKSSNENFLEYVWHDDKVNIHRFSMFGKDFEMFKASQWKSLNRNTIIELLNNFNEIQNRMQNFYEKFMMMVIKGEWYGGACDEIIIPSILKNILHINTDNIKSYRYVNWAKFQDHPALLNMKNYKDESYCIQDYVVLDNLIVRKIDIFDKGCQEFLSMMKNKFNMKLALKL